MSVHKSKELVLVAKLRARKLRKIQTSAEEIFWQHVRDRNFYGKKFYRQYPLFIDVDGKETFYVVDFYCHADRIAIELDGKIHDQQRERDVLRAFIINQNRIDVIRFRNEEIESNIEGVLKELEKHVKGINLKETTYPSAYSLKKRMGVSRCK